MYLFVKSVSVWMNWIFHSFQTYFLSFRAGLNILLQYNPRTLNFAPRHPIASPLLHPERIFRVILSDSNIQQFTNWYLIVLLHICNYLVHILYDISHLLDLRNAIEGVDKSLLVECMCITSTVKPNESSNGYIFILFAFEPVPLINWRSASSYPSIEMTNMWYLIFQMRLLSHLMFHFKFISYNSN